MTKPVLNYNAGHGWVAKVVTKSKVTHIELRRSFGRYNPAQMLVIVSVDGYNKSPSECKHPKVTTYTQINPTANTVGGSGSGQSVGYTSAVTGNAGAGGGGNWGVYSYSTLDYRSTLGMSVRMSLNGPAKMTMDDFEKMNLEVKRAYGWLIDQHQKGLITI